MDIKQVPHVVIETGGEKIKKSYEQIMERGEIGLFDCGIHKIQQEMETQFEDNVLKAVQKVGISIDKPQLERAILDAKSFYKDGFQDAKKEVAEKIKYAIKTEYCDVIGSCEVCKESIYPYVCMTKVPLDEVMKIIDDYMGE